MADRTAAVAKSRVNSEIIRKKPTQRKLTPQEEWAKYGISKKVGK